MTNPQISVVIPCFNERNTIEALISRTATVFTQLNIAYEIIVVDDRSTDGTLSLLHELGKIYPIRLIHKPPHRAKGKAFSLLIGFQHAKSPLILMIDADLQYTPEAIPAMLGVFAKGYDIVVANRTKNKSTFIRRITSRVFQDVFSDFMHGIKVDAQSGLKLFRREIIQRISLHPNAWTFDIEFLVKAQHAGYTIGSTGITLQKRIGKSRVNIAKASMQIGGAAIRQKIRFPETIPFLQEMIEKEGYGFHYIGKKYIPHTKLLSHQTALYRLSREQQAVIFFLCSAVFLSLALNWHASLVIFIGSLTFLYFFDLLFNFYLIYRSFAQPPEISVSSDDIRAIPDSFWPTYSIFCPLYKEPEVIPQFVKAISKLDYPKEKLQVMLLLEEDDKQTILKAQSIDLPSYFEIIVVPNSLPKTKPKACNYGLLKAKGEYCVIYDAEDVPDLDQLKKAVLAFKSAGSDVACIQAKLNFYNPHQNLLTRAFTAEYSLWFDLVLTGLQTINAPIPLGGTSNHFRIQQLKQLNGWDAFNVTEDCDLGMRLAKKGLRTAILDSTTLEEANSDMKNWFLQRSRWIKGYMQSYLVHMRDLKAFSGNWRRPNAITFQLIVGGKVLSMLINPLMWVITISYFVARATFGNFIDSFFPPIIFYMGVFSLIFGNFLYLYYYMVGCAKRGHDDLIKYAILVPLYWLAMSISAYIAFYKLLTAPHHWAKTKHGLHLNNEKAMAQTMQKVGVSIA